MPQKVYTSQNAMWDTGATNTLISPKIVKALGLKATSLSPIKTVIPPSLSASQAKKKLSCNKFIRT